MGWIIGLLILIALLLLLMEWGLENRQDITDQLIRRSFQLGQEANADMLREVHSLIERLNRLGGGRY